MNPFAAMSQQMCLDGSWDLYAHAQLICFDFAVWLFGAVSARHQALAESNDMGGVANPLAPRMSNPAMMQNMMRMMNPGMGMGGSYADSSSCFDGIV